MIEDPIPSRALDGRARAGSGGAGLRSPWWADLSSDRRRGLHRHLDRMILPDSRLPQLRPSDPTCGSAPGAIATGPTRPSRAT